MKLADFKSKTLADAGVKMDITGSEEWLIVHGIGSDAHKDAVRKARVAAVNALADVDELSEDASKDEIKAHEKAVTKAINEANAEIVYHMVSSWSFEDECTPENVKLLCDNTGDLYDEINAFAASRANYLEKK